jgi:shikimate kinase
MAVPDGRRRKKAGIRPRTFPSPPFFPEAGGAGKSGECPRLDRSAFLRLNLAEHDRKERIVSPSPESAAAERIEPIETRIARRLSGRPLVMVGMMGAGKSSIGRRLASRLGMPFVDADAEIEKAANASITEIFERHGEAYFRDGERRVIQRLLDDPPKVLATGGGAFVHPETRTAIKAKAISIWLKADREVLMSRVKRRSSRPLLKTADPGAVIERLIEERSPYYAEATIHIQSRDVAHDVVIDDILTALADFLDREAATGA